MELSLLAGFVGVALVAYLVPGPDWLMVLRGATEGPRHGAVTGLGSQAGLAVHGLLATVGVSALLAAAPRARVIIQVVGAFYLLYLAITGVRRGSSGKGDAGSVGWKQAFVTNITNPKAIVFFAAIAPQFVTAGQPIWIQMLVLTVVDVAIGVVWWTVLAYALSPTVVRFGTARINVFASIALGLIAVGLLVVTIVENI